MIDLELNVWDAWLRERQEHLEETLSNISPSEEPCRYYLLTLEQTKHRLQSSLSSLENSYPHIGQ